MIAGGERAGKSRLSGVEPVLHVLDDADEPDKLVWFVAGIYELAKPEFNYAHEDLKRLGLVDNSYLPRLGSREVYGPGYRMLTKSSDDILRLAAEAPSFVVMCEAAQQSRETFLRLRGRVAERRGSMILSGTFEGSLGWVPEKWREWQRPNKDGGVSFSLPTWSNTAIFPLGENDPEIEALRASYPPSLFQERFGAVPCPPSTLVCQDFDWNIHTRDNIVPDWNEFEGEIELAIDPGYNNPYAVLACWRVGDYVLVVDEIYRRRTLGDEIIAIAKGRPWWPYTTGGVIDVSARAHVAQKSQIEIWEEQTHLRLRSQYVPIEDGITRYQSFLNSPAYTHPSASPGEIASTLPSEGSKLRARIFYDQKLCPSSIAEHGKYKYRDINENRPANEKPIDMHNHSLKAMAYYLVDVFGYTPSLRLPAEAVYQPKFPRRQRVYV